MPNRSKQKGDRQERAIVELLRSHGLDAYRIPLSGAATGFKSDVELRLPNQTWRLESKVRSKGFGNIYRWLSGSDLLTIKADRCEPLAVIPLTKLTNLLSLIPRNQIENVTSKPLAQTAIRQPPINNLLQHISIDPNVLHPSTDCLSVNYGE